MIHSPQGSTTALRNCLECGEPTTGSVGAAGIRWSFLCQPCKNSADGALADRVKAVAAAFRETCAICDRLSYGNRLCPLCTDENYRDRCDPPPHKDRVGDES